MRDLAGLDPSIRLRIEATVLEMFSEQEFHRVNLGELATRARTSLQTIYKYYGSKELLCSPPSIASSVSLPRA